MKTSETKEEILRLTNGGLLVFQHYSGCKRAHKNFRNPEYDDKRPSCSYFYSDTKHIYLYKDQGNDYKGDPSSALLEVLDPEQNVEFHDNYLDIDYDLSNVLFITTANDISTIQPALLDRMELINVTGYLAEEKMEIAKKFLVPKELEEHGIDKRSLKIDKTAMSDIIDKYTHESGVRGLEKQIAKIARVTARKIAMEEEYPSVIRKEHLKEYLGLPTSFHDKQKGNEGTGVVTPKWLTFDAPNLTGTVAAMPAREDIDCPIEEHLIVELYSR